MMTSSEFEQKVMKELRKIPDARIHFQRNSATGGDADMTLFLTGDDPVVMDRTARQVLNEMRTLPTLRDPRINGDLQQPEIVIRPRLDLAARSASRWRASARPSASQRWETSRRTSPNSPWPTGRSRSA